MLVSLVESTAVLIFPVAMAYAAVRDVVSFEVPNWVSVVMVVSYVGLAAAMGVGLQQILWHLSAALVVLCIGWLLFALGWFGGADAKLLAAGAAWTGWPGLPEYLLAVTLAGGVIALGLLAWRRGRLPVAWSACEWTRRLHAPEQGLPYCVAIAIGGLWMFPRLPLVGV